MSDIRKNPFFHPVTGGLTLVAALTLLGVGAFVNAPEPVAAAQTPAQSAASDWVDHDYAKVRLVSAQTEIGDGALLLGVEIALDKGWKTYWRYPGDSGLPPRFDWSGSENLKAAETLWPAPEKFTQPDTTYGYKKHVILPVRVEAAEKGEPLKLSLAFSYGFCDEICVPADAAFDMTLMPGEGERSVEAAEIETFEARVPEALSARGSRATARLENENKLELLLEGGNGAPPVLIVDGPKGVYFAEAELEHIGEPSRYTVELDAGRDITGEMLNLTFLAGGKAWEERVEIR
jgi:DsbC/DsbD-like thiol-disulfide interchange protein